MTPLRDEILMLPPPSARPSVPIERLPRHAASARPCTNRADRESREEIARENAAQIHASRYRRLWTAPVPAAYSRELAWGLLSIACAAAFAWLVVLPFTHR